MTLGKNKDSLLMEAIEKKRNVTFISLLLRNGVDIDAKNKNNQTALHYASIYSEGNENVLNYILGILGKRGNEKAVRKSLLKKDKFGKTPYEYALENLSEKSVSAIEKFLNQKDIDSFKEKSESSSIKLKISSENEKSDESIEKNDEKDETKSNEVLGEKNDSENENDSLEEEDNSSFVAKTSVDIEKKQEELSKVSKENENYLKTESPFLFDYQRESDYNDFSEASDDDAHLAVIKNPNSRDSYGRTMLMNAVKNGNDWEIRSLLSSGADLNLQDAEGWNALMYAVRYQNNLEISKLLIENGADLSSKNKFSLNVLDIAATYNENPEILKLVLKNFNGSQNEIFRAFIFSITSSKGNSSSQISKVKAFIENGVSVNRFYEGKTPLMYACEYSSKTDVIKILLENGAMVSVRDAGGKKAFDYAKENASLEKDEVYWKLNSY